ncbi:MAG: hypothetical protein LUF90_03175 [Rikenellaceae bacterium]|nr:hypothetical protein [Rikenellaceae bacterium]
MGVIVLTPSGRILSLYIVVCGVFVFASSDGFLKNSSSAPSGKRDRTLSLP